MRWSKQTPHAAVLSKEALPSKFLRGRAFAFCDGKAKQALPVLYGICPHSNTGSQLKVQWVFWGCQIIDKVIVFCYLYSG